MVLLGANGWLIVHELHHSHGTRTVSESGLHLTYGPNHVPVQGALLTHATGTGAGQTSLFKLSQNDWHVYWSFINSGGNEEVCNFKATVHDAGNNTLVGKVITANGISGDGDGRYTQPGKFYISIQAVAGCAWNISVKTLPS